MAGCVDPEEDLQEPDGEYDDTKTEDTEDGLTDEEATIAADPMKLNVGFNAGYATQFGHFDGFFSTAVSAGPRLCHAYVGWRVATKPAGSGSIEDHGSPAFIEDWLAKAQGKCDEALISFKSMNPGPVPSTSAFADAFEAFAATDWKARTGFTGTFSFTAWNEPNNGDDAGNGLGVVIPPRVAARYYLAAERSCRNHGCKVAAGDFASNGNMWDDYRMNCRNDNVRPADLCKQKSSVNTAGRPASYLDIYKNEIVHRATEFGLPAGFRPKYFAFHGWHDSNSYLNNGAHCGTYGSCTLRRVLYALRGSWSGAVLWNTEDGVGQFSTNVPDDREQACAAAFMIRLQTISSRVKRLYLTRLRGGPGTLITANGTPRPAMKVFQNRDRSFPGNCR